MPARLALAWVTDHSPARVTSMAPWGWMAPGMWDLLLGAGRWVAVGKLWENFVAGRLVRRVRAVVWHGGSSCKRRARACSAARRARPDCRVPPSMVPDVTARTLLDRKAYAGGSDARYSPSSLAGAGLAEPFAADLHGHVLGAFGGDALDIEMTVHGLAACGGDGAVLGGGAAAAGADGVDFDFAAGLPEQGLPAVAAMGVVEIEALGEFFRGEAFRAGGWLLHAGHGGFHGDAGPLGAAWP